MQQSLDKDLLIDKIKLTEKSEKVRSMIVVEIDPARCQPWKYHDRDLNWLTKERCQDLIKSIQKSGQIEPILVREIHGDPDHDFEIIYGVRRWFACSQIPKQKVLARVTNLDDKICMILMHAENANSKDISEFERAVSLSRQMKSGLFKSQTEMAEAMGLAQGTISKMLKAAEVFGYDWLSKLFKDKSDVPIKRAYGLSRLFKNPSNIDLLKKEAELIAGDQMQKPHRASDILKRLANCTKPKFSVDTEAVLLSHNNKSIVSCRKDKFGKIYIIIDKEAKAANRADVEKACIKAVEDYLFV